MAYGAAELHAAMNAVFVCPQCGKPLGTWANPRPDPLPPCLDCGWHHDRSASLGRPSAKETIAVTLLQFGLGFGAGLFGGAMMWALFLVGWLLVPAGLVKLMERFPRHRLLPPVLCVLGFALGFALVSSNITDWFTFSEAFAGCGAGGFCALLVAWFIAWWRSE